MIELKEAAVLLGTTKRALTMWVGMKRIEGFKIGRSWKFTQAAIDDYIARQSSLAMSVRKGPKRAEPEGHRRAA